MSEEYIRTIENENEQLRNRIVMAEEEAERVWSILDEVKEAIKTNISFTIKTDFDKINIDRSGQIIMMKKKELKDFLESLEDIESFYNNIVDVIENG